VPHPARLQQRNRVVDQGVAVKAVAVAVAVAVAEGAQLAQEGNESDHQHAASSTHVPRSD